MLPVKGFLCEILDEVATGDLTEIYRECTSNIPLNKIWFIGRGWLPDTTPAFVFIFPPLSLRPAQQSFHVPGFTMLV